MSGLRAGLVSSYIHATSLAIRMGFILGLVHLTSADLVGLYALATSIETVVVYLAGLEFHTFTARRYAVSVGRAKLRVLISSHRRLLLVTAPLAAIIGAAIAVVLSLTHDWLSLGLLAVLLATSAVAQELGRYLNLTCHPIQSVLLNMLRTAAWQPIALLFVSSQSTYSLRILLCLWAASTMVGVAWAGFLLRDLWWSFAPCHFRYLLRGLKESSAYYAIASLTVLQSNLERFILQLLLGPSIVGIYSFFQMLSNTLAALVQTAILNIALPSILTRFGSRETDRFEYLANVRKRVLQVCSVTGAAVFALTVPLTSFLSKPDYMTQLWLLPVLIVAQVIMMWTQPIHLALYAARHDRLLVGLMAGALAGSLVLNFAFIELLGLSGAVIAPFVMCMTIAIFRVRFMTQLQAKGEL